MAPHIIVREAEEKEMAWVNTRYDEIGFIRAEYTDGTILIAEVDGKKAGLGRLQNVGKDCFELGGMYVFRDYRKEGLARILVETLLEYAKDCPRIFCLPFAHLAQFYRSFGFETVVDRTDVPEVVTKKLTWCNDTYPDCTLILSRAGANIS